jgi:hypothetical protein
MSLVQNSLLTHAAFAEFLSDLVVSDSSADHVPVPRQVIQLSIQQ